MCQVFRFAGRCQPKNLAHLPLRPHGTSRHPTYGEAKCARFLGWQRLANPKTRHICLFGSSAARPGTPHTERRDVPGFWGGSALRPQKPGTFAFSAQARHVQAPHIRRGEMCQVFGVAAPCDPKNPAHLPFRLKRGTSRHPTYGEAKCARFLGWQRLANPKTRHICLFGSSAARPGTPHTERRDVPGFWGGSALRPQKPGTFAFSAQARHVQAPHIRRGEMCQVFGLATPCEPKNPAHLPFRLKRGTSRHPHTERRDVPGFWGGSALRTQKPGTFAFSAQARHVQAPHIRRGEMCQVFGVAAPCDPKNPAHLPFRLKRGTSRHPTYGEAKCARFLGWQRLATPKTRHICLFGSSAARPGTPHTERRNVPGFWAGNALRTQKPGTFAFSAQARHVQAPHIRRGEMCQVFGVAAPCEPKNPAHLPFRLKRGTSRHPTYGEARCARFLGWQRLATPKTRHICLFGSSAARPGTPHTERRNVPGFWGGSALRTQKPGTFAFSAQARHVQAPHIRRGEMCQVFGVAAPCEVFGVAAPEKTRHICLFGSSAARPGTPHTERRDVPGFWGGSALRAPCEPKNPAHLPYRLKRGTSRQLTYGEAKCARVLGWQRSASPKTWHIYFCGPSTARPGNSHMERQNVPGFWAGSALRARKTGTFAFAARAQHVL